MAIRPSDTEQEPVEARLRPGKVSLRNALEAFESRNFRVLFAGRVTSNMARSMRVFLRAWMTLELTNSPFLMGVVDSNARPLPPVRASCLARQGAEHPFYQLSSTPCLVVACPISSRRTQRDTVR